MATSKDLVHGLSQSLHCLENIPTLTLETLDLYPFFCSQVLPSESVHILESAGIIPDYGRLWNINPPQNIDGTYPIFHDKGIIGGLLKGLFGYNGNPSFIELFPFNSCEIMVGMIALADCLGPYVLKGRTILTGRSNDR